MFLAYLSKNNAIIAIPSLMLLSSGRENHSLKRKLGFAVWSGAICCGLILIFNMAAMKMFPEDFLYFKEINFNNRVIINIDLFIKNGYDAAIHWKSFSSTKINMLLLVSIIVLAFTQQGRKNILFQVSVLWMISYFCLLSLSSYQPSRYFVPLFIPASVIIALGVDIFASTFNIRVSTLIFGIIVCSVLFIEGGKIYRYLSSPEFSILNMNRDIKKTILDDCKCDMEEVVIIGNMANSISLGTGIKSINSIEGTKPLPWKLAYYQPKYYISLGAKDDIFDILSDHYFLRLLSKWDVLHNYLDGKKVYLYKLIPKPGT